MADEVIELFPVTRGPLIRVPACDPGDPLAPYRTYHVSAIETEIKVLTANPLLPNMNWQPVVAIQVEGTTLPKVASNGQPIIVHDALTRVGFWLTRAVPTDGSTIVTVNWQIRAAVGCTPEVLDDGQIKLTSLQQIGLIVQAEGILCTQLELWCRVDAPSDSSMILGIDVVADRFHGASRDVFKGSVST